MNPLRVIKVDNQFAVIGPDEDLPAAGTNYYSSSADHALRETLEHVEDHIDDGGAKPNEIEVVVSEHASADLIRSYGFTPVEEHI